MNFEQALLNPASVFPNPMAVCEAEELERNQKVDILRRWEYDLRELQVATEENMGGEPSAAAMADLLSQVSAALRRLDAGDDPDTTASTKQL